MERLVQRTRDSIVEAIPTLVTVGLSVGGTMLGLGWTSKAESPPTLLEFEHLLSEVCNPLSSGDPKQLLCFEGNLTSVKTLFEDTNPIAPMVLGATLTAGVAVVKILQACYHHCHNGEVVYLQEPGSRWHRLQTFFNNSAFATTSIVLTAGGVLLGHGLASYVERVSPLSQFRQVMDAICTPYPITNGATILCNLAKLNSMAGLFNQTGSTALIIGAVLVVSAGAGGLVFAYYQTDPEENRPQEANALLETTL